ncbi:poly-gamma-glutamate biosynthesis protein PgsC/CapC [Corynebacterium sp. USCH3]|uniref:poly-gamma-glutamate biosynthesis protein PgsC/CapC n=1 Tax=Corynebacterium sp. USCH3 TaxID=3024840 RepID=UPI0030969A03
MTHQHIGSPEFVTDLVHVTFLTGLVVSYLFFRRRQISVGGSLAVGYLASSLYMPVNVVATLLVAAAGYALIRFVVLKLFLPTPRQIFAIGLAVGVLGGGAWFAVSSHLSETPGRSLALVGVIVPGMLCNSLIKQGVARTLVPLAWMLPVVGVVGLAVTMLTTVILPLSLAHWFTETDLLPQIVLLSALSVLFAVVVQEGTARSWKLRTGGYVTAGVIVSALTDLHYIVVLAVVTLVLVVFHTVYSRRVPLFGKDRFFLLCAQSFVVVMAVEFLAAGVWGVSFGGPQNVVFCVLPAIISNDVVQYGWRRTSAGMGISLTGCVAVALPVMAWA